MCWPVGNLSRILYTRTASRLCVPACDESGYSARWKPMKEKRNSLINHLQFIQCEHHLLFHIHSNPLDKIRHLPFRTLHTWSSWVFRQQSSYSFCCALSLRSSQSNCGSPALSGPAARGDALYVGTEVWGISRVKRTQVWRSPTRGASDARLWLVLESSRLLRKINVRSAARTGDKPSPSNWNSTTIR